MKIAIICSYIPTRDAITAYSLGLNKALLSIDGVETCIWGVTDQNSAHCTNDQIKIIRKNHLNDYVQAADQINKFCDVVILQHSHDSFGGENGIFILSLLANLHKPYLVSFHDINQLPSKIRKRQIETIGMHAQIVTAFSHQAMELLEHIYKLPNFKLTKIDYGVSDCQIPSREAIRKELGFENKKVIFSFGFLNRDKLIGSIINAIPTVYVRHSDVHFVFIGQTDHKTLKAEGENYRFELNLNIKKLGLSDRMTLIDRYADEEEIIKYITACDLFITPFVGNSHLQSSVLTQGMASGAAIISTPFWHSNELLSDSRGEFVSETSVEMMAEKITSLLSNPRKLVQMRQAASDHGKLFKWSKLLVHYEKLLESAIKDYTKIPFPKSVIDLSMIPKKELGYLEKLTDDTGIMRNAQSGIPVFKDGYCLDDNANALMLSVLKYQMFNDKSIIDKIDLHLNFIQYMQNDDGGFNHYLSYDRQRGGTLTDKSFGLTLWALGYLMANSPNNSYLQIAKELFVRSAHHIPAVKDLVGMAKVLIGISYYLKACKGDELMTNHADKIVKQLLGSHKKNTTTEWYWFDDSMAQEDLIICFSLILYADITKTKYGFDIALKSLSIIEQQIFTKQFLAPIGRKYKYSPTTKKTEFDQYAIDNLPLIVLYVKLYRMTGEEQYLNKMHLSFMWFLGDNSLRKSLFDHANGGCYQGLTSNGISKQEGAESSVAFWLAYYSYINVYCESLLVKPTL